MLNTVHLSLPLVQTHQAQKEVTVNQALVAVDALMHIMVTKREENLPPDSPQSGEVFWLGNEPQGDWEEYAGHIAYYYYGWYFVKPYNGLQIWVQDTQQIFVFDTNIWHPVGAASQSSKLGINADADEYNRLVVCSNAALFTHAEKDMRVVINKQNTGDVASFIYQTNYSGRAEFGTIGSDDFQLKVSQDGVDFKQALVVEHDTANVRIKQDLVIDKIINCQDNIIRQAKLQDYTLSLQVHNGDESIVTLDYAQANMHEVRLQRNITIEIINPPAAGVGGEITLIFRQNAIGGKTVNFPAEFKNISNVNMNANTVSVRRFITTDGGGEWVM